MPGDDLLESVDQRGVAEQIEQVLLRTHRALDAPEWISADELVDAGVGLQQLLGGVGEPLAERRDLGGDVVAPTRHGGVGVLHREFGEASKGGDDPRPHELEAPLDLQLLDVRSMDLCGRRILGALRITAVVAPFHLC